MRSDVLLTHPGVIGFLFVHEGILTKVYLPKKVASFESTASKDRKSIIAVSGTYSEYTPFSVSEEILLSNVYHITDYDKYIKLSQRQISQRLLRKTNQTFQKTQGNNQSKTRLYV